MTNTFHLRVLAVDRAFYEGDAVSLSLSIQDGCLGLMANHSPMVAAVVPGELHFQPPEGAPVYAQSGSGLLRFERNEALLLLDSIGDPETPATA